MYDTVHLPSRSSTSGALAVLVLTVLSVALVVALGLLAARVLSGSDAPAGTSVSDMQPIDNGCQEARSGQPC